MKLTYSVRTAFSGLRRNTGRSMLTILGIVIGITAIMIVLSVGQGAEDLILNQVRGLGSRTMIIEPGREPQGPSDYAEIFTDSLKIRELEALKNPDNVEGAGDFAPSVMQVATVSSQGESIRTSVMGTGPALERILDLYPKEGDFFSEEDIRQKASVVVLGDEVRRKLFGDGDALGEKIKVKDRTFRVIGLLPKKGQVGFLNADKLVLLPYSTAQDYLFGIHYFNSIIFRADTEKNVSRVASDVKLTLRELHNIDDPDRDDFHLFTQADAVERVGIITTVLTAMLVSVAAISLIVGGVGIMNIMLVSVSERTREIGLRKALGARDEDILRQFLLEAVMLTGMGGVIGIIFGALFSLLAALILSRVVGLDWHFIFPFQAAALGIGVSAAVGLIFGIYPAKEASKKSPIEALRYE